MHSRLIHPPTLPPFDDTLIRERLTQAGYQVTLSEKATLYRKLIHLLGGFESMAWLFEEYMLRLCFDAQLRKGRAYTLAELTSLANPQAQIEPFYAHLQALVLKGVWARGYRLTCPYCGLESWYPHAAEKTACQGCGALFQPPLQLEFAFKPNHLFTQALKNGAVTVLLFLHQMRSVSSQFSWGAGYQLLKDGQRTEVDLITLLGDVLTVVECKDDFLPTHAEAIQAQIATTLHVGQGIGAEAFLFATLKADLPAWLHTALAQDSTLLIRLMDRQALLGGIKYWKPD